MEMVCIVCPNGCRLSVTQRGGDVDVQGARCNRGKAFATSELTNPTRSVTSSVKTTVNGYPVVSVKTDGEIPKSKIFNLMQLLSTVTVQDYLPIGSVLIKNVFDTGVNVITTKEMEKTNE